MSGKDRAQAADPPQYVIRQMASADSEAAAQLRCRTFFKGSRRTVVEDRAGLVDLLARDGTEAGFVADVDGAHAGSVLLVRHELSIDLDRTPWLAGLVVAPEMRRHGIGAALIRAVEMHAFAQGFDALYLYTHDADAFYTGLGWEIVEEFTAFGHAARLMVRRR